MHACGPHGSVYETAALPLSYSGPCVFILEPCRLRDNGDTGAAEAHNNYVMHFEKKGLNGVSSSVSPGPSIACHHRSGLRRWRQLARSRIPFSHLVTSSQRLPIADRSGSPAYG